MDSIASPLARKLIVRGLVIMAVGTAAFIIPLLSEHLPFGWRSTFNVMVNVSDTLSAFAVALTWWWLSRLKPESEEGILIIRRVVQASVAWVALLFIGALSELIFELPINFSYMSKWYFFGLLVRGIGALITTIGFLLVARSLSPKTTVTA